MPISFLHHPLPGNQTETSVRFGCAYLRIHKFHSHLPILTPILTFLTQLSSLPTCSQTPCFRHVAEHNSPPPVVAEVDEAPHCEPHTTLLHPPHHTAIISASYPSLMRPLAPPGSRSGRLPITPSLNRPNHCT
jgi:hypothetical protein